jgi:hypothetical protein
MKKTHDSTSRLQRSSSPTDVFVHAAKDGYHYPSYEAMRLANIAHNQAHLRKLGLDEYANRQKQERIPTPTNRKSRPSAAVEEVRSVERVRRSGRVRKQAPIYDGLADDLIEFSRRQQQRSRKHKRIIRKETASVLSREERDKLRNLPDWTTSMERYLLDHENLSQQNFRSVMRQVRRLASGEGITYTRWDEGVYFYANKRVDLSGDFEALYEEAVVFENEHGQDLGNGWLLRHPIKKIGNFQRFHFAARHEEGDN